MLSDARWQQDARAALMRFSTAGHVAVAVVIATGIINTTLIVGSLPLNWHSAYQFLLSIKILIVFVLVTLAIVNRYLFVPRLARNPSLQPLKWATGAEIVLSFTVRWGSSLCLAHCSQFDQTQRLGNDLRQMTVSPVFCFILLIRRAIFGADTQKVGATHVFKDF